MQKISAYILAYNEAEKIAAAVSSVLWADEIVVADSGSTDGTAVIAERLGARVVQIPFHGFGDLRNRAVFIPNIESVQEVRVQVSTYDAEMGRTGGGVFNATAK